ncbi:hypothetical protein HZY86_01880 [Aerococcaceae bacterium DSM 111020]|nr:hypothetical protein [Aerococcaceae bacterium DSM 111020]
MPREIKAEFYNLIVDKSHYLGDRSSEYLMTFLDYYARAEADEDGFTAHKDARGHLTPVFNKMTILILMEARDISKKIKLRPPAITNEERYIEWHHETIEDDNFFIKIFKK